MRHIGERAFGALAGAPLVGFGVYRRQSVTVLSGRYTVWWER